MLAIYCHRGGIVLVQAHQMMIRRDSTGTHMDLLPNSFTRQAYAAVSRASS